ncbi:IclR family transcriptional regulator [Neomicrococcus lactis]
MANSSSGDSVLDRLVRILGAFNSQQQALTVSALARRANVPRATAYRLVDSMVNHGLLERRESGEIAVGLGLWEIVNRSASANDLKTIAMPYMEDVNQVVQHSTQLSILVDDEVLVLERLSRPGHAVNSASIAARMPLHRTSMGMVLLAFSAPNVAEQFMKRHAEEIEEFHKDFRRSLDHIRRNGYATFDGFIDEETTGAAVPILDYKNRAVAAMGIVVPRDSNQLPTAIAALRTAARGISRALASVPDEGELRRRTQ